MTCKYSNGSQYITFGQDAQRFVENLRPPEKMKNLMTSIEKNNGSHTCKRGY